jgi:transposase
MTIDNSMDGSAFSVFVEKFLIPQLWPVAVVVMDNLSAHKMTSIQAMMSSVGARVIYLSPYSPDFNPIEMWCLQLNLFLLSLAPTTP